MYSEPLTRQDISTIMVESTPALIDALVDVIDAMLPEQVQTALEALAPRALHVTAASGGPTVEITTAHAALPEILLALAARANPMLVGPAGSGKTTLARQCAKALSLPYYMSARVTQDHKLLGYKDGHGCYHRTPFRDAVENGGVFLFDEFDASEPDVFTVINAVVASDPGETVDFPDGMVEVHENFYCIAAGNTYGRGADRKYVGRNQIDAASLDRFAVFDVDYDEHLERRLVPDHPAWVQRVQRVRAAVERENVEHIVSPRASLKGAALLRQGMPQTKVENAVLWKGMDVASRARVERAAA
jgi:MoxR-like ATPase